MKLTTILHTDNGYLVVVHEDDKLCKCMVFLNFAEMSDWLYDQFGKDKKVLP